VRDEARFALYQEKLIATRAPSLTDLEISRGFGGQHTDDVTNCEQIVRALEKLGVKPQSKPAPVANAPEWDRIKTEGGLDQIVAFLGSNPPEPQRQAAVGRLRELSAAPVPAKGTAAIVRSLAKSNWQAFLQGLTFRIPKFQLSPGGNWASVGMAVAYIVAIFAVSGIVMGPGGDYINSHVDPESILRHGIPIIVFLLLTGVAWNRMGSFLTTKAFGAAIIIGTSIPFLVFILTILFFILFDFFEQPISRAPSIAILGSACCISIIVVVIKFRLAR
jgi:hypothetical protein